MCINSYILSVLIVYKKMYFDSDAHLVCQIKS